MTYHVLISDPLSEEGMAPLTQADDFAVTVDTGLTEAEVIQKIGKFHALLVRSQTTVTRAIMEAAPNLKVIGRAGVGVDNIDLEAATELGIVVVNAPDGNTNSAAEHTVAMMMSLARNIPQAFLALKDERWERKQHIGVELKGKTLGIVGMGRIGAEVAYRAKGQRMDVIAYDPFLTKDRADKMGIGYGTLEEVFATSDFLTVHTPLLKETHHMISTEAFAQMKDGVQIMNCARGGIIDEDALYEAIISGKVAGAALDVFEEEPAVHHKLLVLPQVIATPHLGASTVEAQENVAIDVSKDVMQILQGGQAIHPVNFSSISPEVMRKIQPYFDLAEKLGAFLARTMPDAIEEVTVYYAGDLADQEVAPLTRNTVKGLLQRYLGNVNDVNATHLAKKRGITINEQKTTTTRGFTSLVTVEVKSATVTHQVAGTLVNGLGARIVKVDDYYVDVTPAGHMLLVRHKDQPGAIGRVGTLLAKYEVNIATMQVGRSNEGGDAIMMLTVDKEPQKEEVEGLKQLDDIFDVTAITI